MDVLLWTIAFLILALLGFLLKGTFLGAFLAVSLYMSVGCGIYSILNYLKNK